MIRFEEGSDSLRDIKYWVGKANLSNGTVW